MLRSSAPAFQRFGAQHHSSAALAATQRARTIQTSQQISRCAESLSSWKKLNSPPSPTVLSRRLLRVQHHTSSAFPYSTQAVAPTSHTQSNSPNVEGVQERFTRLGLNPNVCKQLISTHPHIERPSPAQSALIPAILSPTDLILRAHTGTGKSFGILLALLSKPRVVFRSSPYPESVSKSAASEVKDISDERGSGGGKIQTGIASIVLVPSNELAIQYLRWAKSLFPQSSLASIDPVIQCLVRGGLGDSAALSPQDELRRLKTMPPHILIATPSRLKDILDTPSGPSLLGLNTLRTLVLDEADAILQLPGRFPSHKQRWKHQVHQAPGLEVLNRIMSIRATFSGGEQHLSAGLENRPGKRRDERRPPEHIRRNAYKAAETNRGATGGLALPRERKPGVHPLQLVCASATANSVMRHFFGARTGWLRTGAKEDNLSFAPQTGRWIDLTGLSGKSMVDQGIRGLFGLNERMRTDSLIDTALETFASSMPRDIEHTCVIVDEAPMSRRLSRAPMRNLDTRLARKKVRESSSKADGTVEDGFWMVRPEGEPAEHEVDPSLVEALAFCFASEGVDRGLALIPARWSLLKTRAALEALGVTVRLASDLTSAPTASSRSAEAPELFLLQTTSSRGLDIPELSHVFLVGYHSVVDAVQYVHAAGRVSRLGVARANGAFSGTPRGKVVTLLRGLPHDTPVPDNDDGPKVPISVSEYKMGNVYKRLNVMPKKLNLALLAMPKANTSSVEVDTSDSVLPATTEGEPDAIPANQSAISTAPDLNTTEDHTDRSSETDAVPETDTVHQAVAPEPSASDGMKQT
ncbi:P-loop containing nucleoside triphosphate hydrolase protein [Testicularia cyperi]|uniref:RNA helicase n=1 Tax=Testicularia cyperi TaxID=1882483 RepID=A0A317XU01_9BASI|nr:P-loop containing nucleoside triphosphate hydrolase protein [Testicularia cyperi]